MQIEAFLKLLNMLKSGVWQKGVFCKEVELALGGSVNNGATLLVLDFLDAKGIVERDLLVALFGVVTWCTLLINVVSEFPNKIPLHYSSIREGAGAGACIKRTRTRTRMQKELLRGFISCPFLA